MLARTTEALAKIEAYGEDEIIEQLESGRSLTSIAREIGVSRHFVKDWIDASQDRSARAREADLAGAEGADQMAEDVLRDQTLDPVTKRELASHYRWRAKLKNRARYGDKAELTVKHDYSNMSDAELEQQYAALIEGTATPVH